MPQHDAECIHKFVPCTLECGEQVTRNELDKHITYTCIHRLVACPYFHIGCGLVCMFIDMAPHVAENVETHLYIAMTKIENHDNEMKALKNAHVGGKFHIKYSCMWFLKYLVFSTYVQYFSLYIILYRVGCG